MGICDSHYDVCCAKCLGCLRDAPKESVKCEDCNFEILWTEGFDGRAVSVPSIPVGCLLVTEGEEL